jgi:hypothetical protein
LLNGPGAPLPAAMIPKFRTAAEPLRAELEHIQLAPAPVPDEAVKSEDSADDDEDLDL